MARKTLAYLSALYEAIRLTALYLITYTLFSADFQAGLGPLFLAAAMPGLALIAILAAAGVYDTLWRPAFLSLRIYKGLSIPVWGLLLFAMLTSPLTAGTLLLAIVALGIVDVFSFLLSFLAPGEEPKKTEAAPEQAEQPEYNEIEVE